MLYKRPSPHRFAIGNKRVKLSDPAPSASPARARLTSGAPGSSKYKLQNTQAVSQASNVKYILQNEAVKQEEILQDQSTDRAQLLRQSFAIQSTNAEVEEDTSASRPSFLPLPLARSKDDVPIPSMFSPQKRGQRFAPGGLASIVQTHVFETGNRASCNEASSSNENEVQVTSVVQADDEFIFVIGQARDGRRQSLMLVMSAGDYEKLSGDDLIELRQPLWSVTAIGQTWTMCISWRKRSN